MLFLLVSALSGITSAIAHASCEDLTVKIYEEDTKEDAQMVLMCNEGVVDIPDRKTIVFIKWKAGELCTVTKECTNMLSLTGTIEAGAKIYYKAKLTLIPKILESEGLTDIGAVKFNTSFKNSQAYCSELKKDCIPF